MPAVRQVLDALEEIAPKRFTWDGDKVGLQVGDLSAPVEKAVVSLDRSLGAVEFTRSVGAQLLLAHHPLIFQPIATVDSRTHEGRTILKLIQNGISFIAAHTNWDVIDGGVNDVLAKKLGLSNVKAFGSGTEIQQHKLVFFCPLDQVDQVVDAVSEAGAGMIGAYRRCTFSSTGTGTFFAGEGANPAVGQTGQVETVEEMRVEMVLRREYTTTVLRALRSAHPYEEPAYDLYPLAGQVEKPVGRVGELPSPLTLAEAQKLIEETLDTRSWAWGDPGRKIRRIGVVGGSADTEWIGAQRAGADLLLTGEVKQHIAVEATESGMTMVAAGHYATEQPGVEELRNRMAARIPEIDWQLFTPEPGRYGRPF